MFRNIFPDNLIGACVEQVSTVYKASYRNESLDRDLMFATGNRSAILANLRSRAFSERRALDAQMDNVRNLKDLPDPKVRIDTWKWRLITIEANSKKQFYFQTLLRASNSVKAK